MCDIGSYYISLRVEMYQIAISDHRFELYTVSHLGKWGYKSQRMGFEDTLW